MFSHVQAHVLMCQPNLQEPFLQEVAELATNVYSVPVVIINSTTGQLDDTSLLRSTCLLTLYLFPVFLYIQWTPVVCTGHVTFKHKQTPWNILCWDLFVKLSKKANLCSDKLQTVMILMKKSQHPVTSLNSQKLYGHQHMRNINQIQLAETICRHEMKNNFDSNFSILCLYTVHSIEIRFYHLSQIQIHYMTGKCRNILQVISCSCP